MQFSSISFKLYCEEIVNIVIDKVLLIANQKKYLRLMKKWYPDFQLIKRFKFPHNFFLSVSKIKNDTRFILR